MADSIVASRYARAMLELGADLGLVELFATELADVVTLVEDADTLVMATLTHPGFPRPERAQALNGVLEHLQFNVYVGNFLRLLLDKGRFALLPEIAAAYSGLADAHAGRVRAQVTAAAELDGPTADRVRQALEASTGKTVVMDVRVDPSLIGGIVAEVEGQVFDASLRSRLSVMRKALMNTNSPLSTEA